MKKNRLLTSVSLLVFAAFFFVASSAMAEEAAGALSKEQKAKIRDEAIQKLNNTEWAIEIRSMDNPKKKAEKDAVIFRSGKIDSKAFGKDGYTGSNLTVTVEDDGHVMWETMQNASGKPPIFWRGDMTEKGINGVISKQLDNGSSESYSFSAEQTGTVEPEPVKKEEVAATALKSADVAAEAAAPVVAEAAVQAGSVEQAAAPVEEKKEEVKAEAAKAEETAKTSTSKKKKSKKS